MSAVNFYSTAIGSQPQAVLIIGDSISAGYGLEPGTGWVDLLKNKLNEKGETAVEVINSSITGDTSMGGRARISRLLDRYAPSVVILELGGNDGLRGLSPEIMRENLTAITRSAQKHGAKVLLLGMKIPPNYGEQYTAMFYEVYGQVAKQTGAEFLPFLLEGVGGIEKLMQEDGIHPNEEAQPILMNNVLEKLSPLLKSLS